MRLFVLLEVIKALFSLKLLVLLLLGCSESRKLMEVASSDCEEEKQVGERKMECEECKVLKNWRKAEEVGAFLMFGLQSTNKLRPVLAVSPACAWREDPHRQR